MSIITISRGSYSYGKEVAEGVAACLGFECIAREVLLEASEQFNVPEVKLLKAIKDAPSFLDRLSFGKERYIAYIQVALLRHLRKDNIVYHGFAGHLLVHGIPHVLKVRIIADVEDRVAVVMKRDGVSKKEAARFIKKLDEQRRKWTRYLYGSDPWDPFLYDIVVHLKRLTVNDAVELICQAAKSERFATTAESQKTMEDLLLASEVKAVVINMKPDIEVTAKDGLVRIVAPIHGAQETGHVEEIKALARTVPGVKEIEVVEVTPAFPLSE